jgi:hypothetical protein
MATALGLNGRLAVSPAFAQKTPDPAKGFVTYKVGTAEVTALYDGIWEKPHDPAFIANASAEDVKAAMVKAGLPADFVSIPFTVIVVKIGGKTVMCDSGTGGQVQPTAGKMMANMKAAGIDPTKINTILISHCHPDHIFGLMEKDTNKPVFPNTEIIISDVEYKFWTDPAVIDRLPEARKGLARQHPPSHGRARGGFGYSLRQLSRPHAWPPCIPPLVRLEPAHDLQRHGLCAGAGRGQSRLARPVRSRRGLGGGFSPQTARPRDRRQDHGLRLSLPLPRRGHHRQGRRGLCAHRHEDMSGNLATWVALQWKWRSS